MIATGVGSMPGGDQASYDEAVRVVLGELTDLPHLPEVPGRGAPAGMLGRALAVTDGLGVDLQPAGWRLTDASGVDHRRARSLLAQDLDGLEERAQGLTGSFKVQVAGPWTLSASVEKPRGDKVLSDVGARRDLAQSLAEGVRSHVRDLRRRLPGVERLVVQVDEPSLAAVLGGRVPTASGFGRHRTVHPPEASEHLQWVLEAVAAEDAEPWVHSCAPETPWALLRGAGARGLSADLDTLSARDHEALAEALDAGETVVLGVVSSREPATAPTDTEVTERVLRWLDLVGLDVATLGDTLVLSPTCGLAGATPGWSGPALRLLTASARHLS
ncbi:methionine synthase [Nocardioides sp. cx-173]|uniref:methionine synthase n=1 Tax=Nocardioides sp. cx-173 TaxID=2898796 RepID=UPI001E56CCFA|nr:methionine synthase [Nocardioides sp. cx-173]MCD4524446.1 methionine synthase [Nocardioides sp. cx-173]UGB43068.1 methionine synthase [Nocardioides sp. cx-173]